MLEHVILRTARKFLFGAALTSVAYLPLSCGGEEQTLDAGIADKDSQVQQCGPLVHAGPDLELEINKRYCLNFSNQFQDRCLNPILFIPEGHEYGTGSKARCGREISQYTFFPNIDGQPDNTLPVSSAGTVNVFRNEAATQKVRLEVKDSEGETAFDEAVYTFR